MVKVAKLAYRKKLLARSESTYRKVAKEMWPLQWSMWLSDRNCGPGSRRLPCGR
jgi:hypothetical protein